jgi:hypothetical protein
MLFHELGHALAVVRLGDRAAHVVVGRAEPWVVVNIGRLHVRFSPLPTRGVTFGGLCVYNSARLSWRTLGLIALAGPLATFAQLIAVVAIAPLLWSSGTFVRMLIVLTAAALGMTLVGSLSPEPTRGTGERAAVGHRDGWAARRAFALHRQGAPPPAAR